MRRSWILLAMTALIVPLLFFGCGSDGDTGPAGSAGPPGPPGPPGPGVVSPLTLESCAICHNDQTIRNGDAHQADYDQRFQDNVVVVVPGSITYTYSAVDNSHNVNFTMTKNGAAFNCTEITTGAPSDSLSIGFAEYNAATRSFDPPLPLTSRLSLGSQTTLTYLGAGVCTSKVFDNNAAGPVGNLNLRNGIIEINGRDDRQGTLASPSRVQLALFPFAGLLETGPAGVNYASAATVDGCQKCHTVPFLKHGFIYGRVAGDSTNDFYTCKGCHMDNGAGGHFIWQLLVNDPRLIITLENQYGANWESSGDARLAKYAYKTRLMNDVHMSHAMEFAYPQSMSNCATCHEGPAKLAATLTDNNFVVATCKSCHPVTAASYADKSYVDPQRAPALVGILPTDFHATLALDGSVVCSLCHFTGNGIGAPVFSAIHTGYDKVIYGDAIGTKYSTVITVTIDNASFVDNTHILTFGFHGTGSLGGVSAANIVPTVLVGLYGYDSKDFLFGPHESSGTPSKRLLEFSTATPPPANNSPRITVTGGAGSWNVTANLTDWAAWIDNNTVRRVEVAVLPNLKNPALPAGDNVVALNAPSRTFNLDTKVFEPDFFGNSIVKVPASATGAALVSGCNNCHDALATTFHSPDRGGNVVVCRMCHITKASGFHLELQSRSIDSYIHAIHRFQAFDTGAINFNDPVDVLEYTHHVQSNFPTFGIENCRACHNAGKFNVPDQSKSLPGVLSNTDFGTIRNIGTIPTDLIVGPATRACGACHRAEAIIANAGFGDPVKLANINSHMKTFGYMLESPPATIMDVILQVFSFFGSSTLLPAP